MGMKDFLQKRKEDKANRPIPDQTGVPTGARKLAEVGGPKKPMQKQNKPKPPAIGIEKVTAKCGHKLDFEIWADKQDKFRKERRQKVLDRPCPECRLKTHNELQAKQKAEAAERRKNKPPKDPRWKRNAANYLERLPNGSTYSILPYDANKLEWSGTLTIPGVDEGGKDLVFSSVHTALFKLLSDLDSQWRKWLEEKKAKEMPVPLPKENTPEKQAC